ncbi:MAG TPA: PilN domain-containing protein [Planctomycetota bacterium]|nr:PilN domain-containing protein [Planctomycetota bacterium]
MKQINLIPADYKQSQYVRRRAITWIAFVLAVAAMVSSIGLNLNAKITRMQREQAQLQSKTEAIDDVKADLQVVAVEKKAICEKLQEIYAVQRRRTSTPILHEIAAACNDKVFLNQVSFAGDRAAPVQPAPAGSGTASSAAEPPATRRITLKGYALTNLDLTQFVSMLSASTLLNEVNMKFWRQEPVRELKLIGFEIECFPRTGP